MSRPPNVTVPDVGDLGAGDAFHQRALAGAVGPDQAVEFVLGDGEIGAVQRRELAEHLDEASRFKKRHDYRFPAAGRSCRRARALPSNRLTRPAGRNRMTSSSSTPRMIGQMS